MWNSNRSVKLSSICTKLVIIRVVISIVTLPEVMKNYMQYVRWGNDITMVKAFTAILYASCVPALIALVCLDRLLNNIKGERIFINTNVKYLRKISWCCFGVAGILLFAGYYYLLFILVAFIVAFMGLILRVVKNVIEQAIILKDENDYTI